MIRSVVGICSYLLISVAFGQSFTTEGYYMFPINPGKTNYLAGTMGEMRGTHFHGGIDIRTGGRIGLPVHAVADGYITRIKVQLGGYGHSLYMKHPNGTTSVYAHLDHFDPQLEQYLISRQYEAKSYEIDLFPQPDEFPFRQGEIIAYSGNTGSSSGPHLHFEIRDEKQRVLDPLKFGFEEIIDRLPPTLKYIAFVTLDENARVNGAFGRYEFQVSKVDDYYRMTKPLSLKGKIGIEIQYQDRHNGSGARNGIPEIVMAIDDDTVFHQRKTRMVFGEMRNIVVHMDYPVYAKKRRKFNKLFKAEGNTLSIYKTTNEGIFFDGDSHNIKIHLIDSYGNRSTFDKNVNNRTIQYPISPVLDQFEILDNIMHIQATPGANENISVLANGLRYEIQPYSLQANNYYTWDLNQGLPNLIVTPNSSIKPSFLAVIPSGQNFQYYHQDINLKFRNSTLFDTLYLRYEKRLEQNREIFDFRHQDFPIRRDLEITLKPEQVYDREKAHVYAIFRNQLNFVGGEWVDENIKFSSKDLGTFTIQEDRDLPTVTIVQMSSERIVLLIEDQLSGIKTINAYLDGEWLLMKYDAKRKRLESQLPEPNKKIEGEFILEVKDNAGNLRTYKKTISNS